MLRQAGGERRLARRRLADAGRQDTADQRLVDVGRIDACVCDASARSHCRQLGGRGGAEGPLKCPDRRAPGGDDNDGILSH